MKKIKYRYLIVLYIACTFIIIQTILKVLPDVKLQGAELKTKISTLSGDSFFDNSFFITIDKWLTENIGFRGVFIKLDNQINYSLFTDISSKYPNRIILGKDHYLYQKGYIDAYNKLNTMPLDYLENKVKQLKVLQDYLLKKRIRSLLIISPSKAAIYPEYIEENYIIEANRMKKGNYDNIIPLLKKYGIVYIDGREIFKIWKQTSNVKLFSPSGIHWTYYSSYLFTSMLISELEKLFNKKMVHLHCSKKDIKKIPYGFDNDMVRFANIIFTRSFYSEYIYPVISADNNVHCFRPNILIIGSSFCWQVIQYLDEHKVFNKLSFYYYNNTEYSYPGKIKKEIDKNKLDRGKEIFSNDIIIFETNEAALHDIGFNFFEETNIMIKKENKRIIK